MVFETVIGLEVHAQLKTQSKLFCSCSVAFGASANQQVCPVCLGLPGALPVLNKQAVYFGIIAGLMLNCRINRHSVFARKNYFYPDLPKGYQISQFELPLCEKGYLDILDQRRIGITRIHLEEDAGKLNHIGSTSIAGAQGSLVDLNRASTPLIEIVSEPDLRSGQEARAYMELLKTIVEHAGICDGNLEEGSLRADANISLRPMGSTTYGTRTEVKNLNSFRSLEMAIQVEVERQKNILLSGGTIVQETRNFDEATQSTTSLRSKTNAHDYRYFPEPDLPPLVLTEALIQDIQNTLPEHPQKKKDRYLNDYHLSESDCKVLLQDIQLDAYFRETLEKGAHLAPKDICNWVIGDLTAVLKEAHSTFSTTPIQPEMLCELLTLIHQGTISGKMAKDILVTMQQSGQRPKALVDKMGGGQISDESELRGIVDAILDQNLEVVVKVKSGKSNSADFLIGQIMKATKGKAKPDLARALLLEQIEKRVL